MSSLRELVARRIAGQVKRFPDLDIGALETRELPERDAALAAAIDHAIARRWLTLRALLEPQLQRGWDDLEAKLRAILLVGAAQLFFLERVPDHAVINEAVDLAKLLVRPRAGGLVNAVLRRTAALRDEIVPTFDPSRRDEFPLGDGRAWRLTAPVFAESAHLRCAQHTSIPPALLARWEHAQGRDRAQSLAMHTIVHPPILIAGLPADAPHCIPHAEPGFHVLTGPRAELASLLASNPGARVQDPASAAPVAATEGLDLHTIVDACAGRGTKTRQLRALHPDARIFALEHDGARLGTLRESFADDDRVTVLPFAERHRIDEPADLLLLDVPCSNTGVLARRVEARYRFSPESLKKLVDVQRQIVADTLQLLAPSGQLLYTTCSIEPEENDAQADWITRWHRLHVDRSHRRLPEGGPGAPPERYGDGGGYVLFNPGS